jgi:hypothetical protein
MPDVWGFTKPTADKVVAFFGEPRTISRARTQRNKTPWKIGGASILAKTPSVGIPARSGATLGSATCTRISVSGGTRSETTDPLVIYNNFLSAVSGDVDIIAAEIDGIWIVQAEDCS